MEILGTTVTNDLNWNINTQEIIKKVNKRLLLLRKKTKLWCLNKRHDSVMEVILSVSPRTILNCMGQLSVASSLLAEDRIDLERTQKCFVKLILKNKYKTYEDGLLQLNLQTLEQRRRDLSLKFANDCLKQDKFKSLFPEMMRPQDNKAF